MHSNKRLPGAGDHKARRVRAMRPGAEALEGRALLAAIDLVNVTGSTTPNQPGPFGVELLGIQGESGTGYSVASVGDVNGDGFDDFVVGAPTIVPDAPVPVLANGNGNVYLVFGSQQSNGQNVNWLNLTPNERVGDLGVLGNSTQNNPLTGLAGFPYNGLTFTANANPNELLGASVAAAGDVNADGFADFLIGAPQALDLNNGVPGTGRAYLIYGGQALSSRSVKTVDLDNTTGANNDLNIITFVNNQSGALTGFSVAAVGDVITDGFQDIAIGAPNASFNGLSGNGAVYLISGGFLRPARTQTVNLALVGQAGNDAVAGVIFSGALSGSQLGSSVSAAGNFNNDRIGVLQAEDLLIGATQANTGPGSAIVVYGSNTLPSQAIVSNGVNQISISRLVPNATNPVLGAIFNGQNSGDQTGFSVAPGGDFNDDGVGDILVGSPFFDGTPGLNSGRVSLVFGRSTPNTITGVFNLTDLPTSGIDSVEFQGPSTNAAAGFSVSPIGSMNSDNINEILIGAPGFNNAQGIVYLIPGNPDLLGTFNLALAEAQPVQATLITLSQPTVSNYLGSSVSGRFFSNAQNQTVDADGIPDLILGAAGFNPTINRFFAGGVFALEGAFVPIANIVTTSITSNVGTNLQTTPNRITLTDPSATFYILSGGSNTPGFIPPIDINPATIQVNGVALPDPSSFQNAGDVDGDGIDDASFVFSPLALLGFQNGRQTVEITARTLNTSQFPNRRYSGSNTVIVSGGGGGGGGAGIDLSFGPQFQNLNAAAPPFGERFLPQFNVLARARWKPLPVSVAYQQFLPQGAFAKRLRNFFHPDGDSNRRRSRTLESGVFTRGRFPNGVKFGRINHGGPAIGDGLHYGWPYRNR